MGELVKREELQALVGKTVDPTAWFKMEQDRINLFADATLDHQFIHIDEEAAKKTPFGSTIAHGFLSLSMLSHFAEQFGYGIDGVVMGINYGFDKVRFIHPVNVNSEIRAVATLKDAVEKNPGQFMLTYQVTVEIKGVEKPALMADWLTMQVVQ